MSRTRTATAFRAYPALSSSSSSSGSSSDALRPAFLFDEFEYINTILDDDAWQDSQLHDSVDPMPVVMRRAHSGRRHDALPKPVQQQQQQHRVTDHVPYPVLRDGAACSGSLSDFYIDEEEGEELYGLRSLPTAPSRPRPGSDSKAALVVVPRPAGTTRTTVEVDTGAPSATWCPPQPFAALHIATSATATGGRVAKPSATPLTAVAGAATVNTSASLTSTQQMNGMGLSSSSQATPDDALHGEALQRSESQVPPFYPVEHVKGSDMFVLRTTVAMTPVQDGVTPLVEWKDAGPRTGVDNTSRAAAAAAIAEREAVGGIDSPTKRTAHGTSAPPGADNINRMSEGRTSKLSAMHDTPVAPSSATAANATHDVPFSIMTNAFLPVHSPQTGTHAAAASTAPPSRRTRPGAPLSPPATTVKATEHPIHLTTTTTTRSSSSSNVDESPLRESNRSLAINSPVLTAASVASLDRRHNPRPSQSASAAPLSAATAATAAATAVKGTYNTPNVPPSAQETVAISPVTATATAEHTHGAVDYYCSPFDGSSDASFNIWDCTQSDDLAAALHGGDVGAGREPGMRRRTTASLFPAGEPGAGRSLRNLRCRSTRATRDSGLAARSASIGIRTDYSFGGALRSSSVQSEVSATAASPSAAVADARVLPPVHVGGEKAAHDGARENDDDVHFAPVSTSTLGDLESEGSYVNFFHSFVAGGPRDAAAAPRRANPTTAAATATTNPGAAPVASVSSAALPVHPTSLREVQLPLRTCLDSFMAFGDHGGSWGINNIADDDEDTDDAVSRYVGPTMLSSLVRLTRTASNTHDGNSSGTHPEQRTRARAQSTAVPASAACNPSNDSPSASLFGSRAHSAGSRQRSRGTPPPQWLSRLRMPVLGTDGGDTDDDAGRSGEKSAGASACDGGGYAYSSQLRLHHPYDPVLAPRGPAAPARPGGQRGGTDTSNTGSSTAGAASADVAHRRRASRPSSTASSVVQRYPKSAVSSPLGHSEPLDVPAGGEGGDVQSAANAHQQRQQGGAGEDANADDNSSSSSSTSAVSEDSMRSEGYAAYDFGRDHSSSETAELEDMKLSDDEAAPPVIALHERQQAHAPFSGSPQRVTTDGAPRRRSSPAPNTLPSGPDVRGAARPWSDGAQLDGNRVSHSPRPLPTLRFAKCTPFYPNRLVGAAESNRFSPVHVAVRMNGNLAPSPRPPSRLEGSSSANVHTNPQHLPQLLQRGGNNGFARPDPHNAQPVFSRAIDRTGGSDDQPRSELPSLDAQGPVLPGGLPTFQPPLMVPVGVTSPLHRPGAAFSPDTSMPRSLGRGEVISNTPHPRTLLARLPRNGPHDMMSLSHTQEEASPSPRSTSTSINAAGRAPPLRPYAVTELEEVRRYVGARWFKFVALEIRWVPSPGLSPDERGLETDQDLEEELHRLDTD